MAPVHQPHYGIIEKYGHAGTPGINPQMGTTAGKPIILANRAPISNRRGTRSGISLARWRFVLRMSR